MQKTLTTNHLISYLYNEADVRTRYLVEEELSVNWSKLEFYNQLKRSKEELQDLSFKPSRRIINAILNVAVSEM